MRIIAISSLRDFWSKHPEAKSALTSWVAEVRQAEWSNPADLRNQFPTVSILQAGRVVFDIAGNKFRLVAQITYRVKVLYVKFIGTHAQYDRINAQTIEWMP